MDEPSLQLLVFDSLSKNKKLAFYIKKGYRTQKISGHELLEKINSFRNFINEAGVKKQDKIIILGYPSIEWLVVYLGCLFSDITAVPLDALTDKELLKKICEQVKPKAVFQSIVINISSSNNIKSFFLEDLEKLTSQYTNKKFPMIKANSQDIFEIQFTSGTTGDPKGVILTHENVHCALQSALKILKLKIHLRFLNILPLSHVFAQIMGLFIPIKYGFELYFVDTVQPRKLISFIRNKGINGGIFVPGILASVKKELEGKCVFCNLGIQFRLIGVGGAPLDSEIEKWWKRKLVLVLNGYGMTETSSIIAANSPFASRSGSVGKIAEGVKIKFGEDNEILVKGKNITKGYYQNDEKTNSSFEDGWFKTGDVGEIRNNYLYMKERKKDVIITSSGMKAYPADIENVLNSIKGVKESCVFQKNNNVHSVLIVDSNRNCDEIIKEANEKLLSHQKIFSCSIWPEMQFPRTPTGKVKKFALIYELENSKARQKYTYENRIFSVVHEVLKPNKKIKNNSKLVDLGMDSLKRVELISEIEKQFDVEIDEIKIDQRITAIGLEKIMKEGKIERIRFRIWTTKNFFAFFRKTVHQLIFFPLVRFFTKTKYFGIENLEEIKEPVIFISNHQSAFDVPVIIKRIRVPLAVAASPEVIFGIGVNKLKQKILRKILGYYSALVYNAFPFGTAIGTDRSLEFTGEMIDRGFSIMLFPEGERTEDGKIHDFKPGIGFIISSMKVPIIPVRIKGLFEIYPRWKLVPKFGNTEVVFGKPFNFTDSQIKKMTYEDIASLLEKKVKEL